jgi:hypothetical protein
MLVVRGYFQDTHRLFFYQESLSVQYTEEIRCDPYICFMHEYVEEEPKKHTCMTKVGENPCMEHAVLILQLLVKLQVCAS